MSNFRVPPLALPLLLGGSLLPTPASMQLNTTKVMPKSSDFTISPKKVSFQKKRREANFPIFTLVFRPYARENSLQVRAVPLQKPTPYPVANNGRSAATCGRVVQE